jgi:hypothetical protein
VSLRLTVLRAAEPREMAGTCAFAVTKRLTVLPAAEPREIADGPGPESDLRGYP